MRELMINQIHAYHWLDYSFERGDNEAEKFGGDYVEWLRSLTDEDLLSTFSRLSAAIDDLD